MLISWWSLSKQTPIAECVKHFERAESLFIKGAVKLIWTLHDPMLTVISDSHWDQLSGKRCPQARLQDRDGGER